jgi:hypothetical protein
MPWWYRAQVLQSDLVAETEATSRLRRGIGYMSGTANQQREHLRADHC